MQAVASGILPDRRSWKDREFPSEKSRDSYTREGKFGLSIEAALLT